MLLRRLEGQGIPGSRRVAVRGADHLPQMTHAAEVNRSIEGFLRGR